METVPKISYVPAVIRAAREVDMNFVYHSWLKSYRASWAKGTNPVRYVDKEIYYHNQKEVVRYLLENSVILIAHNAEDEDQIFGYIVGQPSSQDVTILHYCFVKQPFRNMGIATMLLAEMKIVTGHTGSLPLAATHATGVFHGVLSKRFNIMYNPYLVYREYLDEDRSFENSANH